MIIPKKLKILAHNYVVKEVDGLTDSGSRNASGKHIILLDARLAQTEKEETLFHEILHAINPTLKETDVEFLAQTIYLVLLENNLLK